MSRAVRVRAPRILLGIGKVYDTRSENRSYRDVNTARHEHRPPYVSLRIAQLSPFGVGFRAGKFYREENPSPRTFALARSKAQRRISNDSTISDSVSRSIHLSELIGQRASDLVA